LKDFGADCVFNYGEAVEKIGEATSGKMADVVLNSIGSETWSAALDVTGVLGRLVFFGTLTGNRVELDLNKIYGRHIRIIGTTGGRRDELEKLIAVSKNFKLRTWKKFRLEDGAKALGSLFSEERDGRILLELNLDGCDPTIGNNHLLPAKSLFRRYMPVFALRELKGRSVTGRGIVRSRFRACQTFGFSRERIQCGAGKRVTASS
jgi:hypothetical protein